MDKKAITDRLAGRMGASEQVAEAWLEAVLDILHGAYTESALDSNATAAAAEKAADGRLDVGTPILRSVTPTARMSIGDEITVDRFPFRVGREGRKNGAKKRLLRERRGAEGVVSTNELYLKDFGKSVNVSREHFQIEAKDDGSYELVDRGSACGTIVSDHVVGGNFIGGRCPLKFGDSIIVGTRHSAIVFEFCLASA